MRLSKIKEINDIFRSISFTTGPVLSASGNFCWNCILFDWTGQDWPGTVLCKNPVPFIWTGWGKSKTQSYSCLDCKFYSPEVIDIELEMDFVLWVKPKSPICHRWVASCLGKTLSCWSWSSQIVQHSKNVIK